MATGIKLNYEIHESHLPVWERQDVRYIILMGGRGNGRSGTASRFTISRIFGKEYTRGAIMRAVREDIRASCWQALNDRLLECGVEKAQGLSITDGDMEMSFGSNSIKAFGFRASSGSLTARLKSLEGLNYAWIEEGEEIGEEEFMKFDDTLRTTRGRIVIVITLNTPPKNHWIINKWFDLEPHPEAAGFYIPRLKEGVKDVLYIPGTWRENEPNLDKATVERYQNYKITKPDYYWQVIEGLSPEVMMGKIYQGWREIPDIPHEARFLGYALDFGFDPDPLALLGVYYLNGGYVIDEEVYGNNITNPMLAESIKVRKSGLIIADSAEPKSIAELKEHGINIVPCSKGPDSVNYGIKHVQGLRVSYTSRSINVKKEYENYGWKIDKNGNNLGIEDPKCANHTMSAFRYFAMEMIKANADPEAEDREKVRTEIKVRQNVGNVSKRYGL